MRTAGRAVTAADRAVTATGRAVTATSGGELEPSSSRDIEYEPTDRHQTRRRPRTFSQRGG